jgi:ABC-type dipeptide/oligopeptide/nickel transport system permease component
MSLSRNYKLEASSLIESVMAIAIISICISIATLVYVKLLQSDYELAYYKAKQKITELHLQTIEEQLFENESYNFESYNITKQVKEYSFGLYQVDFELQTKTKKEILHFLVKVTAIEEIN